MDIIALKPFKHTSCNDYQLLTAIIAKFIILTVESIL